VSIEWWYVNAHVTTEKGRHLALIGSFFRFGNGRGLLDPTASQPRAHYLIYAVTDLDKKTQRPYSLADGNMVALLQQVAPLLAVTNPNDKGALALLAALKVGKLPPPSRQIAGIASVVSEPFRIAYGTDDTLTATNDADTAFSLDLGGGRDKVHLTLSSQKPAMAVGGNGETGLTKPTDMYYYSLTRCAVGGTIDTGGGPEKIVGGQGWFDHQWGNSWVAQNDGWDWWGVQLDDGTDILFFRQRDLSTGKVFFPLATFMDRNGHQSVTRKIVFTPDKKSLWKSAKTGVTYPLGWTVTFPEEDLALHITTSVKDQEMPILGPGSGIWEGACEVKANYLPNVHMNTRWGNPSLSLFDRYVKGIQGVAYMELVGYNSPAVKRQLRKGR
jgi:predicted secreted hydrolase